MPTRRRKSSGRRYSKASSKSVESAMRRRKHGTLKRGKSGHGGRVTSRKQAIAIGLSEAREKGEKVPPPKSGSSRRSSRRSTSHRSTSGRSSSRRSSSGRSSRSRANHRSSRSRSHSRSART